MHPARRRLAFLSAAIAAMAAVLALVLPATTASAAAGPAARNGVGAHHPGMILPVGVSRVVSPAQDRCEAALQATIAAGACVAVEDAATAVARTVEILGPKEFNPNSLEGLTPNAVRNSIPSDWIQSASKSGEGEVFRDPFNAGRQIRIMPGYPAGSRPDLITTGPYAVVSQNGVVTKIPLFGNPMLPL
jgi:hypothetical protein